MSTPPALRQPGGYLTRLTSARGVACMVVLTGHCFGLFAVDGSPGHLTAPYGFALSWLAVEQLLRFLFNGDAAVMVFFTLSGCVLAMQLDRMRPIANHLRAFYVRRLFRIYPVAIAAVLIGLVVVLVLRQWTSAPLTTVAADAVRQDTSPLAVLLNLAMVVTDLNTPLWSLKVEIYLSIAFPLIYWAVQRPATCMAAVTLCTALLFADRLGHNTARQAELAFVVGAALPRYLALRRTLGQWELPLALVALVGAACARRLIDWRGMYLLVETVSAFLIIRSVYIQQPDARWLDHPAIVRLGELSYGLYAVHMPILWITAAAIAATVGAPAVAAHGAVAALSLFAIGFPVSLGLAILGHRTLELPGIALGRRLGRVAR